MWDSVGKENPTLRSKGRLQNSPRGGRPPTDQPRQTKDPRSNTADLSAVAHLQPSRSDFVQPGLFQKLILRDCPIFAILTEWHLTFNWYGNQTDNEDCNLGSLAVV